MKQLRKKCLFYYIRIVHKLHINKMYYAVVSKLNELMPKEYISYSKSEFQSIVKKKKVICTKVMSVKEEKYDLSIIIPAYNASLYIERCLDSVLNQKTLYRYEVIVINDGSIDATESYIKKYQKQFENITYISQCNKGISATRNIGVENALGKYIMFVDADDVILDNCIERLLSIAIEKNADIVEGSYYHQIGVRRKYIYHEFEESEKPKQNIWGVPWGKVMKKELFYDVMFPEKCVYEDSVLSYLVYPRINKAVLLPDLVYGYTSNKQGITQQVIWNDSCMDTVYVFFSLLNYWKIYNINPDQKMYELVLNQLILNEQRIVNCDDEIQYKVFLAEIEAIEKYFRGFVSTEKQGKMLEKIIKEKDFKKYKLFCLYFC